jgi:regulator of extracellular matrix RemA (YlzA/DUF370 family)
MTMTHYIKLGRGGWLAASRIVAVARARSAPVRRLLEAAGPGRVINLTYGYPRESVVLLDNGCLAVTSLTPEELLDRLSPEGGVF